MRSATRKEKKRKRKEKKEKGIKEKRKYYNEITEINVQKEKIK